MRASTTLWWSSKTSHNTTLLALSLNCQADGM